ncbi:MAG: biotin/lipoyl-binding protein [Chlorobi bacterium]|nr:biotin/lipoyl-binding protein [Chlorobiota bacterium]
MAKKFDDLVDFPILSMKYKTRLTKKFKNRKKYEEPNPNNILSYIPGTIVDIFVRKGKKVKKGDPLLILEAMKMRNQIVMPFDGKIVAIHVKKGDKIPKNFLMIEVENTGK